MSAFPTSVYRLERGLSMAMLRASVDMAFQSTIGKSSEGADERVTYR